ncbi:uncharacterized protein LOC114844121 [Betta splendens]|uniref:Uncharacterized protein LOC114844121 n=1 Tax=Betta splendens TaxID=158456 RepID=A0A6P7KZL3_BETSP|nr:uncharacterized protein LOC114844121 [Betta splendens]
MSMKSRESIEVLSISRGNFKQMAPPVFALYLACLFIPISEWAEATELNQSTTLRFLSVNFGQNVTLKCSFEDSVAVMFYWYKQALGEKPEIVSKFYKHEKNATLIGPFQSDPRFQVDVTIGKKYLKIASVQSSDSANYFCVGGYSYLFEFVESVFLAVVHSGSNVPALVHQSASGSIQPGGSVTLNCTVQTGTCDGQHSVYWFKDSGEAHPGLIYTHGDRNDQCERKPDTRTRTCVYNLEVKDVNPSNVGTYYCAVATCGWILFGNGTNMDVKDVESFVLVYLLSGALVFTTLLVAFLAYTVYRTYKANGCQCTDTEESSQPSVPATEVYEDAENLHYAALRRNQMSRSRRPRDDTSGECVYSHVRS